MERKPAVKFEYEGIGGEPSHCDLEVVMGNGGAALVICSEREDNPGTSVSNAAEFIATRLCRQRPEIDPQRLVWIEHYSEHLSLILLREFTETWWRVVFEFDPRQRTFSRPDSTYITREEAEKLRSDLA